ncbi:CopG family transcriptional regulator [Chlorobium sp. N1]|uniref:type II toxin-antitoxin system BrnA family antitoxin n=1 Tax=Chlorobium sp. N1 TaxID=2491138 RepID=UPI00103A8900|nr:CopG family transcriptional regulator [Chlorobium sp. N1]TCD48618.1 CopG family transcriptional regulator [Chlorobium sp. N1]
MRAEEFDRVFEGDREITPFLDLGHARRVNQSRKRVGVALPLWMVDSLDREAKRLGVSRQSLIKVWVADRLTHQKGCA